MAQAPDESSLIGQAGSSTAATILRNYDPLTQRLRNGTDMEMAEIARLDRTFSPAHDSLSSLASTSTTPVFSVRDESTVTKPTSTGTPYPLRANNGKGKAKVPYASSLSVAYGSGSEAELEHRAACHDALLAMGEWAKDGSEPLKGAARAQKRDGNNRQSKTKKPPVRVIEPVQTTNKPPKEHDDPVTTKPSADDGPEPNILRRRATQHDLDSVRRAEEGQPHLGSTQAPTRKPLSRTRICVLVSLTVMMMLTFALSAFAAHYTGKTRMGCTKGIVFGTTVLTAVFTILALLVARRAPQEALLAGLVEIIVGFMLLAELNDFM